MATVQRYVNTASSGGDGTTNATSGSTAAYASLSSWEANSGGSATDDYIVDCCGTAADTTACVVDFPTNITTGSITIRANTGEVDGFYDGDAVISTSHYRLDGGNTFYELRLLEQRCRLEGLQVISAHSGSNGIAIYAQTPDVIIRKCRVLNTASCDYGMGSVAGISSNTTRTMENNLVVGFDICGVVAIVTNFFTPTVTIQHNTIYCDGSATGGGIRYGGTGANSGTVFIIKGNAVGNCGSGNDLIKVSAASSTDTFDDDAFEYSESTSGEIALGTMTDAWTSPGTATSSDFTVKNSSSSLNFTVTGTLVATDIRDVTRSNYSVGAFEFVASGTTVTGALGTAAASGFTGTVDANRTIAGALGTAIASGLQGTVSNSTDTTIAGNLGTATASGFTGGVNANRTIAGALGTAVASGFQGTVSNTTDTVIGGTLGIAIASGLLGNVNVNRTIAGNLGTAVASGFTGTVQNGTPDTLDLILKILRNRQELNPATGTFTLYDDDATTVLYTTSAWADAAGTVPYAGGALRRIDALF